MTFTPYVVSVTLGSDPDGLCLLILFVWQEAAKAHKAPPSEFSYTERDVILYALGGRSEKLQAVAYKLIFCKMQYMQYLNNLYLMYYYWFQFIFYIFFHVDVYFFMKIFWKTIAVMILIIVDI